MDWQTKPDMPWLRAPTMTGAIRRDALDQFRRYRDTAPDSPYRTWAATLPG